jgi:hypothetical protein
VNFIKQKKKKNFHYLTAKTHSLQRSTSKYRNKANMNSNPNVTDHPLLDDDSLTNAVLGEAEIGGNNLANMTANVTNEPLPDHDSLANAVGEAGTRRYPRRNQGHQGILDSLAPSNVFAFYYLVPGVTICIVTGTTHFYSLCSTKVATKVYGLADDHQAQALIMESSYGLM